MQRLFQKVEARLRAFIEQRSDFLLLLRCHDDECAYVLKMLEAVDGATEHIFWMFAHDFHDPASYVQGVVNTFYERVKQLNEKLVADGEPPWPPLPPKLGDPNVQPPERIRILFLYARQRIPDLDLARLAVVFAPLRIIEPLHWRAFLRELVDYDPTSPWCHHMRLIAREASGVLPSPAADVRAYTDPEQFPHTRVYSVDLSIDAMHAATKEDMADRSLPLAERANALLLDAAVDYSNHRYEPAMQKYELLSRFSAAANIEHMHALALNGMGEVFGATRKLDSAVEHFEMAMTPAIESKNYPIVLIITLNLGNLYLTHQGWAKAAEYYTAADALAGATLNVGVKLLCLENIGVCQQLQGDYMGAQRAWQEGVKLARATEEDDARKRILRRLRGIYEEARMYDQLRAVDDELRGLP